MAKWGFGEASGARGILVRLDIFGMPGVRSIVGDGPSGLVWVLKANDGLSGLVWVLELTSAISPAHRLSAYRRAYLGLIIRRSGKWGLRGRQVCVGMGQYRWRSVPMRLDGAQACHAEKW